MSNALMNYEDAIAAYDPVLGLEVHVELNTNTKMFCGRTNEFGGDPNTHVCPVCLGLPGSLPVMNRKAVESAIRIGLALNCQIAKRCRMARKNYFYPDMTKDFQTSQYDEPIAFDGFVDLELDDGSTFRVEIERAHMEEDAGKSLHVGGSTGRIHGANYSLMDYNRAGTPLIEIVTKIVPGTGAKAPQVARAYVAFLRDMMRALHVSDVKMEQGSLRCDANVSLSPKGSDILGTRTETKNVNSLRSIEAALTYEIRRQAAILANGGKVKQETRMWNEAQQITTAGRSKEEAEDYRYFPEPDLVPVAPPEEWVQELRNTIPEVPAVRRKRLQQEFQFTDLQMRDIVSVDALDVIAATVAAGATPQAARKWWTGDLARQANELGVALEDLAITPQHVAHVQKLVDDGALTDKLARVVFAGVLAGDGEPDQIIAAQGLAVVSDTGALQAAVADVIAKNTDVAEKIRGGKVQAVGALIGQVMKAMGGKADAAKVKELILQQLS